MDDTRTSRVAPAVIGTTALGRLHLRVLEDDGFEEVVVERRWPDMASARTWCERTVGHAAPDTTVLEIQVFEESWVHTHSWETTNNRPVAESLQLGVIGDDRVHWSESRPMSPRPGVRHVY